MTFSGIDIFCHVIDNFGDAGLAYRFAAEMKRAYPSCRIRLFIDDIAVLSTIEPRVAAGKLMQEHGGIVFVDSSMLDAKSVGSLGCADILIESLGCYTPECYLEKALFECRLIINLEYLSAEKWIEQCHLKESLLPKGTAKKYFFMQGITESTGGVILNSRVQQRKKEIVERRIEIINDLLYRYGIVTRIAGEELRGTVFTYERGFDALIRDLKQLDCETLLLCFGQKSRSGMERTLSRLGGAEWKGKELCILENIRIVFMPFITQQEYDTLLCCTDFNLVRGEDSLVQAIGAAKPFIWNAYLQDDKYHLVKVEAFCAAFQPYFEDENVFVSYRELLLEFNNAAVETSSQSTGEQYHLFFRDLKKIEQATSKLCYFLGKNCNLVEKISGFISEYNIR